MNYLLINYVLINNLLINYLLINNLLINNLLINAPYFLTLYNINIYIGFGVYRVWGLGFKANGMVDGWFLSIFWHRVERFLFSDPQTRVQAVKNVIYGTVTVFRWLAMSQEFQQFSCVSCKNYKNHVKTRYDFANLHWLSNLFLLDYILLKSLVKEIVAHVKASTFSPSKTILGLNPKSSPLSPEPWALSPEPWTLNSQPSTLNPESSTLNQNQSSGWKLTVLKREIQRVVIILLIVVIVLLELRVERSQVWIGWSWARWLGFKSKDLQFEDWSVQVSMAWRLNILS